MKTWRLIFNGLSLPYEKYGYPSQHPLACAWRKINVDQDQVSPDFRDPRAFIEWAISNGWQDGLHVCRLDVSGIFSPENCRVLTVSDKVRNSAVTKFRLSDGSLLPDLARETGVAYTTLLSRVHLHSGDTPDDAISKPVRARVVRRASDGRLGHEVAKLNGINAATYRCRLRRGISVDVACGLAAPSQPSGGGGARRSGAQGGKAAKEAGEVANTEGDAPSGRVSGFKPNFRKDMGEALGALERALTSEAAFVGGLSALADNVLRYSERCEELAAALSGAADQLNSAQAEFELLSAPSPLAPKSERRAFNVLQHRVAHLGGIAERLKKQAASAEARLQLAVDRRALATAGLDQVRRSLPELRQKAMPFASYVRRGRALAYLSGK